MTRPYVLGLTGSIGMGKSTTAKLFAEAGCAVWDADEAVHRLYATGGAAVEPMHALWPDAIVAGAVSRPALKDWIAKDPAALDRIERVVHPLVAQDRIRFLDQAKSDIVVLDIPLLFERGKPDGMDAVAVVTAPADVQKARVLSRPGMTEPLFASILARQVPDSEKRKRADFLIETIDLPTARTAVIAIIDQIRGENA